MKNTIIRSILFTSAIALAGSALTGCSSESDTKIADQHSTKLEAVLLEEAPSGAISVAEARTLAKPGQHIVVTGQIGAAHKPFAANYASFVLGDKALDYCNERPGDNCDKPWDACCEPKEKITAMRASVQLLENGEPIAQSLRGFAGLTELDEVVVAGIVDPTSTPDNLIINASGIYRASN